MPVLVRSVAPVFWVLLLVSYAAAQDINVSKHVDPVPEDIAPEVKGLMADGGVRATIRDTAIDFWLVKSLAVTGSGSGWAQGAEGALVGAVRLSGRYTDVRGKTIRAGVYTLRYGIQPANSDHLGVSGYREFLLINPAAADTNPKPAGHDGAIDLSKRTIGTAHPAVWSLDPPVAKEAPLTVLTNEAGRQSVIVEVPTSSGSLRFGVILIGRIEA